MPSAAERAIQAFERATGLTVCVQERGLALGGLLAAERFSHQGPLCTAAKLHRNQACRAFDLDAIGRAMAGGGAVRMKVCHAGIVEWVGTLRSGGRQVALLFAGQRREAPAAPLGGALRQARAPGPAPALPTVGAADAAWIAEMLEQLTARLDGLLAPGQGRASSAAASMPPCERERTIRKFVAERHARGDGLAELARLLRVGPERARHVVRSTCGAPLRTLLTRARLDTAVRLLGTTGLPLASVARASGFADIARFHRCFKAAHGRTPGAYRRSAAGAADAQP